MRRLFLVGLSCVALACGDTAPDGSSADASGTDGSAGASTGGSSGPSPESTSNASTPTSDVGSSTTDGDSSGQATSSDASTGGPSTSGGSETGGSEESGPALPRGQWAVTEITYTEGGDSETLSMQDRTFCDATLSADSLLLRYQQAGGYTVWSVTIPISASLGTVPLSQDFSGVYMNINEVGDDWQSYFDPSMAFGSLELTEASLQSGGVVAGILTATLTSGDGSTTADFSSTFYAEIP